MPTTHTPEQNCPYCNAKLGAATELPGATRDNPRGAQAGDITVCLTCANPLVFTHNLYVRKPSDEELVEFARHPEVERLREVVRSYKNWRTARNN